MWVGYVYMNIGTCREWKYWTLLGLELQASMNCQTYILVTELRSLVRAVLTLNCWAISPTPSDIAFNKMKLKLTFIIQVLTQTEECIFLCLKFFSMPCFNCYVRNSFLFTLTLAEQKAWISYVQEAELSFLIDLKSKVLACSHSPFFISLYILHLPGLSTIILSC